MKKKMNEIGNRRIWARIVAWTLTVAMVVLNVLVECPQSFAASGTGVKDYDFWVDIWPQTVKNEETGEEIWNGTWAQYEYQSSDDDPFDDVEETWTLGQALLHSDLSTKYREQYGQLDKDLPGTWAGDNDDVLEVRPDGTAFVKAPGYVNVTFTYEGPDYGVDTDVVIDTVDAAGPVAGPDTADWYDTPVDEYFYGSSDYPEVLDSIEEPDAADWWDSYDNSGEATPLDAGRDTLPDAYDMPADEYFYGSSDYLEVLDSIEEPDAADWWDSYDNSDEATPSDAGRDTLPDAYDTPVDEYYHGFSGYPSASEPPVVPEDHSKEAHKFVLTSGTVLEWVVKVDTTMPMELEIRNDVLYSIDKDSYILTPYSPSGAVWFNGEALAAFDFHVFADIVDLKSVHFYGNLAGNHVKAETDVGAETFGSGHNAFYIGSWEGPENAYFKVNHYDYIVLGDGASLIPENETNRVHIKFVDGNVTNQVYLENINNRPRNIYIENKNQGSFIDIAGELKKVEEYSKYLAEKEDQIEFKIGNTVETGTLESDGQQHTTFNLDVTDNDSDLVYVNVSWEEFQKIADIVYIYVNEGQGVIFNVKIPSNMNSVQFPNVNQFHVIRDGKEMGEANSENNARNDGNILWNLYTEDNDVYKAYDGEVKIGGVWRGTVVAPEASVNFAALNGSVICKKATHAEAESHKNDYNQGWGEKRTFVVEKIWQDNETSHDSITVTLKRRSRNGAYSENASWLDDDTFSRQVVLNDTNGWEYEFTDLESRDEKGDLYDYYVVESGYDSQKYDSTINGGTIINSLKNEKTKVTVQKKWVGVDPENAPPIEVQLLFYGWTLDELQENGNARLSEYGLHNTINQFPDTFNPDNQKVTLNESNNWTYTWENLPASGEKGPIDYGAKELNVPSGYTSTGLAEFQSGDTYVITNTSKNIAKFEPAVQKKIIGKNERVRDQFHFEIKAIGGDDASSTPMPQEREVTVVGVDKEAFGEITFTEEGTYTYEITETKGDIAGYTYDDSVWILTVTVTRENGVLQATGSYSKENSGTSEEIATFTNIYTEGSVGSLKITKTVVGGGTEAETKTYTFTVTGPSGFNKTVTIHQNGNATLTGLVPGEYTVTEQNADIDGYTLEVTGGGNVTVEAEKTAEVTVTNTYTPDESTGSSKEETEPSSEETDPSEPTERETTAPSTNPTETSPENPTEPSSENPTETSPENPTQPSSENPTEPSPENPTQPSPENPSEPDNSPERRPEYNNWFENPQEAPTEIPENPTPLSEMPPIENISDEPTPLSSFQRLENIEDEDVPLAFMAPITGDEKPIGAVAVFALFALGMMAAFGILASKKSKDED